MFAPCKQISRNALVWVSIHPVIFLSTGPPVGGLYLQPPLSDAICEDVMTVPSVSLLRLRL